MNLFRNHRPLLLSLGIVVVIEILERLLDFAFGNGDGEILTYSISTNVTVAQWLVVIVGLFWRHIIRIGPKVILLNIIFITLSIGLVEYIAGQLFRSEGFMYKLQNGKHLVELYARGTSTIPVSIRPHPYMLYTNEPNYIADGFKQHNSLGYRNEEFSIAKAPGIVRILALGGSTTYMFPYVPDPHDTWCNRLQEMLSDSLDVPVQVVNAGLSYGTSAELLSGFVHRHRHLKPDMVILHTGGNDAAALFFQGYNPEYTHFRAHGNGSRPRKYEKFFLRSNMMKILYASWLNNVQSVYMSQPASIGSLNPEQVLQRVRSTSNEGYRRNIDYLIRLIKQDSSLVVTFGFLQAREEHLSKNRTDLENMEHVLVEAVRRNNAVLEGLSRVHLVPYVAPDQDRFKDEWFQDNCHLTEEGEKEKARILFPVVFTGVKEANSQGTSCTHTVMCNFFSGQRVNALARRQMAFSLS